MPKVTTRRQINSPRKNQFIGALKIHGNISRACRDYDISSSTGNDLWKKYWETGSTANRPRSGCPAIFSAVEKAQIVEYTRENRRKPFRDIGNEIMTPVSASTIRNIVAEKGYHRRVARKVPYISAAAKQKRLNWAKEMKEKMTVAD